MKKNKRVFGIFEAIFDLIYLSTGAILGIYMVLQTHSTAQTLAGVMALVLAAGDAFHLVPRVAVAITGQVVRFERAMGFGKFVTSITMTIFYLLLWQVGLLLFSPPDTELWSTAVYGLAIVRILLCLLPQNRWCETNPPIRWGIYRNLPFLLLGVAVAALFAVYGGLHPSLGGMWVAIALSFACYLPVVLWSQRKPMLGMLMIPKTCAYLWIILMCLTI